MRSWFRRSIFLTCQALWWALASAHASQVSPGQTAKVFSLHAGALCVDPVRPRVYAALLDTGKVAVIDTATLKVTTSISVGSDPSDLALSPDGSILYVADAKSPTSAITAVDLNTLQVQRSLTLPAGVLAVAAGLDGRLYVSLVKSLGDPFMSGAGTLCQVDAMTGVVTATLGDDPYDNTHLQISPDRRTLYSSGSTNLTAYDVSLFSPVQGQRVMDVATGANHLILSHDGRFLCLPRSGTNEPGTILYSTADLTQTLGHLSDHDYGTIYALSPDDTVMYAADSFRADSNSLSLYDTQTGALVKQGQIYQSVRFYTGVVDASGSYLFVSTEISSNDGYGHESYSVLALTTGGGTAKPAAVLPVITSPSAAFGFVGIPLSYRITATNQPTSFGAANLPAGFALDPKTGVISGTSTSNYGGTVVISATNAAGTASTTVDFAFDSGATGPSLLDTQAKASGVVNVPFAYQIQAQGQPSSYEVDNLPVGLSLNKITGAITGTPTQAGDFMADIKISNYNGTDQGNLFFHIDATQTTPALPSVTLSVITSSTSPGEAPAVCRLDRDGDASSALTISYQVKGNAVDGVDYGHLSGSKIIPAGMASVVIKIRPVDNPELTNTKKVIIKLQGGDGYLLGGRKKQTVQIVPLPTR